MALDRRGFLLVAAGGLCLSACAPAPDPTGGATNAKPVTLCAIGGSSYFGAGATGSTPPKHKTSVIGQLRTLLAGTYGDAGSGLVLANPVLRKNPTWDERFAFGGQITDVKAGWFQGACYELPAGPVNYVQFTATAASFVLHRIGTGQGACLVSIDGGAPSSLTNTPNAGTGAARLLTDTIPAGTLGAHTVKVWGEGGNVRLWGVESRTGTGRIIVDGGGVSGKSLADFVNSDEADGTYGLPMVDDRGAWLALIGLGANDWQKDTPLAMTAERMEALCARVKARGGTPVIHIQPIPSPALQPAATTWEQHRENLVQTGARISVKVVDHSYLWGPTYDAGKAKGMYADTIHPNDAGALSLATALRSALGL
jgi:lysophospholipase L1-like esterase